MPLEVDSAYYTECGMKAIRNRYGLWFASYLARSLIMLFLPSGDIVFDMGTVVGILAFGRRTTCIAVDISGRCHQAI